MTTADTLALVYICEEQGASAKRNGEAPWANPFERQSPYYRAWERGWDRENERATA